MSMLKAGFRVFNVVFKDRFLFRCANLSLQCFLFLLFLLFAASFYNLGSYLDKTSSSVVFYAFFKKGAPDDRIERARQSIANWPEVARAKIIGRTEGLAILKKSLGKESSVLGALETNPLPVTAEIAIRPEFTERESIAAVAAKLRKYDIVDWHDSTERYLGPVLAVNKFITRIFIGGTVLIALLVIFSLRATVKSLMHKYGDAVALLRLLGASRMFIVLPFILEGFFETLFSSVVSSCLSYYILAMLKAQFALLNIAILPLPAAIYGIFIAVVAVTGAAGGLTFKKIPEL